MGTEPGSLAAQSLRICVYGLGQLVAAVRYVLAAVRATAFWGTILLPFVIVGSLVTGLATAEPPLFAVLLGLNVLCIVFGRRYSPGG